MLLCNRALIQHEVHEEWAALAQPGLPQVLRGHSVSILAKSGVRVTRTAFPGERGGSNGQKETKGGKVGGLGPSQVPLWPQLPGLYNG